MTTVCVFYSAYQVCRHGLAKLLETCGLPQDTPVWKRIDGFDFAVGTKQALDDSLPSPSGDWEQAGAVCDYWKPYPRFSKYVGYWVPVDKYLPEIDKMYTSFDKVPLLSQWVLVATADKSEPTRARLVKVTIDNEEPEYLWQESGNGANITQWVTHWRSLPDLPR